MCTSRSFPLLPVTKVRLAETPAEEAVGAVGSSVHSPPPIGRFVALHSPWRARTSCVAHGDTHAWERRVSVRQVWETSLGDKIGRPGLGDQFGRPVWETSLGDQFGNVLSSPFPFAERNSEFCSRLCFPHSFFWGPVYSSRIALTICSLQLLSRFALSNCSPLQSHLALSCILTNY